MQSATKLVEALMRQNELNRTIWQEVLNRGKNKREVDVDRLRRNLIAKTGLDISRQDFVACFKEYQKQGLGKLVHGQGKRANFTFRLKEQPSLIRDELFPKTKTKTPSGTTTQGRASLGANRLVYVHTLQNGTKVRLELPANISPKELAELADSLREFPL